MIRPSVDVIRVGAEGESLVVIDGFAPDPDRLVNEAEAATLTTLGAYYPGVRAPVGERYCAEIGPLVAGAARRIFGFTRTLAFDRALFSLSVTPPADLALAQRIPHIDDVAPGKLAIVHYLSHADWGGTRFFRHRSTAFETITPTRHRDYLDALADDLRMHGEPAPGYIEGDTAIFADIGHVAPAYNRAVIYRSSLLHCAAISNDRMLPPVPRDGRLTIASFLSAA